MRDPLRRALLGLVAVTLAAATMPAFLRLRTVLAASRPASVAGDFNGDGFADLAVGVPGEDLNADNSLKDAGTVNVIYGSPAGLTATGNQRWDQNSPGVDGVAEAGDGFGSAVATGDFNGDGFADLAVGAPGEDLGTNNSIKDAGLVGTNQGFTQDTPGVAGVAEGGDGFGTALATGDFNGDGFADLAVGVPGEDIGTNNSIKDVGLVNVLLGSPDGLVATGSQAWTQATGSLGGTAAPGDAMGSALAAGDFNADGFADLSAGAPHDDESGAPDAGTVNVLYGSGAGLTDTGNQLWAQGTGGVLGTPASGDLFGSALASGDFDGNGRADLAIGAVGDSATGNATGAVNVLYGSASGLRSAGNDLFAQGTGGILGTPTWGDRFGTSLAAGDFGNGSQDDLAVGVSSDAVGSVPQAGSVNVIYGSSSGLTSSGDQVWSQGGGGLADVAESGDDVGSSLVAENFGNGSQADLAVGAGLEDLGTKVDAGAVSVVYGSPSGLSAAGNQFWSQGSGGISGKAETGDHLGLGYAAIRYGSIGAQDWPDYLLDPNNTSFAASATAVTPANAATLGKVWTWVPDPPTKPGQPAAQLYASPTVADGRVFIGTNSGDLYALDAATGAVVWKRFVAFVKVKTCSARGFTSTAAVAPDPATGRLTVYVAAADGYLYALNADDGAVVWRSLVVSPGTTTNAGYNWGSPMVVDGHVYMGMSSQCDNPLIRGGLKEFTQSSGALLHTYYTVPSGSVGGSIWSSAAGTNDGGSVFVSTGNADQNGGKSGDSFSIVKLNGGTLKRMAAWMVPGLQGSDKDFGASPTMFSATISGTHTPMVGACNKNGRWYALKQNSLGSGPVWSKLVSHTPLSLCLAAAIWDGSHLFIASDTTTINGSSTPGAIREVDPATGAFLWSTPLGGAIIGSPALDGAGVIAAASDDTDPGAARVVYLVDASTGAILDTINTGDDPVFAQPVFAGNLLLVATTDNGLTAYAPPD